MVFFTAIDAGLKLFKRLHTIISQNESVSALAGSPQTRFYQNSKRKFRQKPARNARKVAGQALSRF